MKVELTCPSCGFSREIPREKIPQNANWAVCPRCRHRFSVAGVAPEERRFDREEEPGTRHDPGAGPRRAPWENRSELGLIKSLYETVKQVLFAPGDLFRNLSVQGGIKEPLAFGLLMGSLGNMMGLFWQFLMVSGGLLTLAGRPLLGQFTVGVFLLLGLVIVPFFVAAALFFYSAVLHLLLLVVRGGGNGFEATFRVISYTNAAQLWGLVPFIGGWIGGIWQFVVQVIGLKEIHRTSYWRVILAFLIPAVLFLAIFVGLAVKLFLVFQEQGFSHTWS